MDSERKSLDEKSMLEPGVVVRARREEELRRWERWRCIETERGVEGAIVRINAKY